MSNSWIWIMFVVLLSLSYCTRLAIHVCYLIMLPPRYRYQMDPDSRRLRPCYLCDKWALGVRCKSKPYGFGDGEADPISVSARVTSKNHSVPCVLSSGL
ncbi:hypothetical protein F5B19DRAFT_463786 [Rostrohypoxylon terebratum]|nr:hypothetical protein F5B19DRAFT_463786 [Rostrohypoxylon terebratum]